MEQLLIRDDIDVNVKTDWKDTPLRVAARNGYEAVVERLLARQDLDANSGDNRLMTALIRAAYEGHEAIVKHLLRRTDANLNTKEGSGWKDTSVIVSSKRTRFSRETVTVTERN